MQLLLQQLPQLAGPNDASYHGLAPKRALFMRPEAAQALLQIEADTNGLVYTDIYRSPDAIRQAYRAKPGTQPVAFSFHGYGGCVDLDVEATVNKLGTDYNGLSSLMENRGYWCHRRDGRGDGSSESWHFNFLGDDADRLLALTTDDHATWAAPAEAMIQKWYGAALAPSDSDVVAMLSTLQLDVRGFQRAWDLVVDGIAGPRTRRVLAFVTAEMKIISSTPALT